MPVHATNRKASEGYAIVEDATGRVVAHGKTKRKAHIAAWIRNREHKKKMEASGLELRYMDAAELSAYWDQVDTILKPIIEESKKK